MNIPLTLCFTILVFGLIVFAPDPILPVESLESTGIKGTGSMLPLMYPDAVLDYIPFDGNLKCGHIYIYNNLDKNYTVAHRFVYEAKNGDLYFKGDNNDRLDLPINKSDILNEVVGIR